MGLVSGGRYRIETNQEYRKLEQEFSGERRNLLASVKDSTTLFVIDEENHRIIPRYRIVRFKRVTTLEDAISFIEADAVQNFNTTPSSMALTYLRDECLKPVFKRAALVIKTRELVKEDHRKRRQPKSS